MTDDILLQLSLFWRPALTGALLALCLAWLGLYLRLRQEYWAALAYGQVGAAGALGALALGCPPIWGGLAANLALAGLKRGAEKRLPAAGLFPLLFILGWGVSLLLSANLPAVERAGAALFEGQLYFADAWMLPAALGMLAAGGFFLWRKGPLLLLAHVHPAHFHARSQPGWPLHAAFDCLAAAALALAVMSLGVMGAFALVFIPPWLVFAFAPSWRIARIAAPTLAFLAYTLAFALALIHDQPFGPVLALVLGALTLTAPLASLVKNRPPDPTPEENQQNHATGVRNHDAG